jgi:hypothetical protein
VKRDCVRTVFTERSNLSLARRQLLDLIERYYFCRIENLEVRAGEPVFDHAPHVTEEIKFGSEKDPEPELVRDNVPLRAPIVELFDHLERLGNGRIACLQIRHGLPFRLFLERRMEGPAR